MTSSIFSSDAGDIMAGDQRRRACSFCVFFIGSLVSLLVIALGGLAFLDPFATGRLTLIDRPGIAAQMAQTANASFGRDQAYDSAIFGNSHIELLDWRSLSAATGLKIKALVAQATAPRQQLAFMNYFRNQHSAPRAIIIGLDATWCLDSLIEIRAFPYWLYDASNLMYLRGLFRYAALQQFPWRVSYLLGQVTPIVPPAPDEALYIAGGMGKPDFHARMIAMPRGSVPYNATGRFVAVAPLQEFLAHLPPATAVVLVWTPVFINYQYLPDTPGAAMVEACHQSFSALAAARPRTAVVNWATDRPENRNISNFWDATHYRASLAHTMELDIAANLNAILAEK